MKKTHTNKEYEVELKLLQDRMLLLADRVKNIINNSVIALLANNKDLAVETIKLDTYIDKEELIIDEQCIEMLAKRQPLGQDLRFIVSVLKMVTYFERLGDLAVNICERILKLDKNKNIIITDDLKKLAQEVQSMLEETIEAFLTRDSQKALAIIKEDNAVDELYHKTMGHYINLIASSNQDATYIFHLLSIAKWLERMGDHCTNLAEVIIFMVKGEDIRHSQISNKK